MGPKVKAYEQLAGYTVQYAVLVRETMSDTYHRFDMWRTEGGGFTVHPRGTVAKENLPFIGGKRWPQYVLPDWVQREIDQLKKEV